MWIVRLNDINHIKNNSKHTNYVLFNESYKKYFVVIGGCLVQMSFGGQYSFGNLVPYIVSYIAYTHSNSSDNSKPIICDEDTQALYAYYTSVISWIYSASIFFYALGCPIGGKLGTIFSTRIVCLIATLAAGLGMVLSKFCIENSTFNFYFLICSFGGLYGIACGVSYTSVLVCVMKWWPAKKALVASLTLFGAGSAAFAFDFIQTFFINPNNVPFAQIGCGYMFNNEILDRTPMCFIILAAVSFGMQIIGIPLLFECKQNENKVETEAENTELDRKLEEKREMKSKLLMHMDGSALSVDENIAGAAVNISMEMEINAENDRELHMPSYYIPVDIAGQMVSRNITTANNIQKTNADILSLMDINDCSDIRIQHTMSEAIYMRAFWQLFFNCYCNVVVLCFVQTQWKMFAQNYLLITDDTFLATVGSVSSLMNGFARIFWGIFIDYNRSFAISMATITAIMTIFVSTLPFCSLWNPNVMLFVWICMLLISIGGNYSFFPPTIAQTFGMKNSGYILGWLYISELFAGVTQAVLFQIASDDWIFLCLIMGAFSFMSFLLSATHNSENPKRSAILKKYL